MALDCEMADMKRSKCKVVLLYVINYLSSKTLINRLVNSIKKVVNWQTHFNNITAKAINATRIQDEVLKG